MHELPGDDLVADASWTIDRRLVFHAPAEQLWPWLVQLGKDRGGWYLPRYIERLLPAGRRATRRILPQFQDVAIGDDTPDWGPGEPVFRLAYCNLSARSCICRCATAAIITGGRPTVSGRTRSWR